VVCTIEKALTRVLLSCAFCFASFISIRHLFSMCQIFGFLAAPLLRSVTLAELDDEDVCPVARPCSPSPPNVHFENVQDVVAYLESHPVPINRHKPTLDPSGMYSF